MTDRDPTPGELRIMFNNILDNIREVKDTMATKDFVNGRFETYNDRLTRVETDLRTQNASSSAEHVRLAKDIEAQEDLLRTEIEKVRDLINGRIDAIEAEQKQQEQALRAQRNGRAQSIAFAVLGAILSIVGSVVASGIIRGLFPAS